MDERETFGEWFRKRRQVMKQTQVQVAEELGVPQTYVSRWEVTRALPTDAGHLLAIAKWAGVETAYVLKMIAAEQEARR